MKRMSEITALILAGGLGSRLRSVVSDRPKVLAEVDGRPFLAYLLDELAEAGIRRVVLSTGYLGEQVRAAFGGRFGDISIDYVQEPEPLGTGGALCYARSALKSDPVLVLNGDSLHYTPFSELLEAHQSGHRAGTLVVKQVPDCRRYGSVTIRDEAIVEFSEKNNSTGAGWINAGIYMLSQELLASIPAGRPVSLEREVLPVWANRGLYAFCSEGKFIDIGTPASYARAANFVTVEEVSA